MAFESLDTTSESRKHTAISTRLLIIVSVCILVVSFTVGLLIGIYGVKRESKSETKDGVFLDGVSEAIIREEDHSVTDWIFQEIKASNIRENLRELVKHPHVAGTPKDFEQADMLRNFWLESGLDDAVVTSYDVLLSYPDDVIPNIVTIVNTTNNETVVKSPDKDKNLTSEENTKEFPFPYLGYSGTGTVKGPIVYVNYGRKEDFDAFPPNVSGCIVLARYGRSWRAEKVKLAQERGAVGVILYSDPADYVAPWATDYYPDSIWIPGTAASRGSIFMGNGDPLTPGYPSIDSAYRYNETDSEVGFIPNIPAMPIGYDIAKQILELMGGDPVPDGWSGKLLNNSSYKFGPGFQDENLEIELSVHGKNERRKTYNAFGIIKGEVEPDRYVLLGNHRDSWVLGAVDPSSGTATMMELSRVLGDLVKRGAWRPRRSIIFCSWGAEEFALIGSTEWVEENSKVLDFRSVAYINMDIAVTGNHSIRAIGSPPVFSAMYEAAKKVQNPNESDSDHLTVYDNWLSKKPLKDPDTEEELGIPQIVSPNAGSDYGPFQLRAGITCADFRYRQDYTGDGVLFYPLYHTGYETFYAVDKLIDPGFKYHATIGKLSGELLRDLADSKIIPFNMSDYVLFMEHYLYAFQHNASNEIKDYNLDITALTDAIETYEKEAKSFHEVINKINQNNPFELRRVNDQLMQIDRSFLDPAGLPRRQQSRNVLHSVTDYNAFPAESFPGLKDALYRLRENKTEDTIRELQHQFTVLVFTIQSAANTLKESTKFLRHSPK
ncbi:N-acetylated-alpha-linked acidic dipeptidase 2 [Mactra antiquata]